MTAQQIVAKLWNYCNVLRDDGLSYGDYVEQLTFLLFLKMAHERTQAPWKQKSIIPAGFDWPALLKKEGDALEVQYRHTLEKLGKETGMLGLIFRKAQNKIQDPAKLRRLIVDLIDREQWVSLDADVKGDAYEGLLEKNAQDTKGGAGQYFTPRALIQAIVACVAPKPGETICDPACGTGGFLLDAHDYVAKHNPTMDRKAKSHLKLEALRGVELVDGVARLCAMNLLLHGIGPTAGEAETTAVAVDDALRADPGDRFDVILTNPPFGRKSSVRMVNDQGDEERQDLTVVRDDFWTSTSNKQLAFMQHVKTLLRINGRAAVVIPVVISEPRICRRDGNQVSRAWMVYAGLDFFFGAENCYAVFLQKVSNLAGGRFVLEINVCDLMISHGKNLTGAGIQKFPPQLFPDSDVKFAMLPKQPVEMNRAADVRDAVFGKQNDFHAALVKKINLVTDDGVNGAEVRDDGGIQLEFSL